MKNETIILGVVAVAAIAGGYFYYMAHKNAANQPVPVSNNNPNQRSNNTGGTDQTVAYVNTAVDTLGKLADAYGGW